MNWYHNIKFNEILLTIFITSATYVLVIISFHLFQITKYTLDDFNLRTLFLITIRYKLPGNTTTNMKNVTYRPLSRYVKEEQY